MAADFIMPRLPDQHQAHYFPHHHQPMPQAQSPTYPSQPAQGYQSQQISPLSTSNNASPTSSKSYHHKRLRPLYIPAVLRPTEHHSKKSRDRKEGDADDDDAPLSSSNSFISLPGLGAFGRLSRRSTGDSGKCMDGDWNLDLFPKPTASPTRQHWKPDPESAICDEPSCRRNFNYWTRRHHCRKCGNIFCDSHSTYGVPLDQNAEYNPRGIISRACAHCYTEFQAWRSRTNSQASSENSSVVQGSRTAPASPIASTPTAMKPQGQHQEIAASVPRDWNWSTF